MLLAASESAVTKKPRLRFTTRRSSSVRPFGSFHSWMSRLMLISCGIQWLAQAARYFSHAHLYLKGTSWLTSALELMTCLSSTVTRRKSPPASGALRAAGAPSPVSLFSNVSMAVLAFLVVQARRLGREHRLELGPVLAPQCSQGGLALRLGGQRQLERRDVQIPLGVDDAEPFAGFRVLLEQILPGKVLGLIEAQGAERQQSPARREHRVEPRAPARRPQRRHERTRKAAGPESDHWHASQSGLSMAQNLGSAAASAAALGTAFSSPLLTVDFSAWVAPSARR